MIQYVVKFPAGVAFFYENKETKNYTETIKFEVINLQGVDIDISREVHVEVGPG